MQETARGTMHPTERKKGQKTRSLQRRLALEIRINRRKESLGFPTIWSYSLFPACADRIAGLRVLSLHAATAALS